MPELPEIETVKLQLEKALKGEKILTVEVIKTRSFTGDKSLLEGNKITKIRRIAKVLLIDVEGNSTIAFHFKMTGQLVYVGTKVKIAGGHPTKDFTGELPSSHTRVIFNLEHGKLYFNDQRLFGWVKVFDQSAINNYPFFKKIGPEPIKMTKAQVEKVIEVIKRLRRPIKVVIMDQEIISGMGNIYANDALWEAGIKPDLTCNHLTFDQLILLFDKMKLVLQEGIKYGGATAADEKYVSLHGMGGHYQDHFRVYGREGKKCLREDGGKIEKFTLGGRGTYWCSECQV